MATMDFDVVHLVIEVLHYSPHKSPELYSSPRTPTRFSENFVMGWPRQSEALLSFGAAESSPSGVSLFAFNGSQLTVEVI